MIPPLQSDDVLLADIERTCAEPDGFRLWWLGQSGFLVQHRGRHLLLDPYLSDSLTRKYARTDKPHVRMTERVIAPERLDFVDVATSSHNHTDHLDAETLGPLLDVNPGLELVIPEANRAFVAKRLESDPEWPRGLTAGASVSIAGFTFHGVPAAHNDLETDAEGRHLYMGYVVRFGPYTIYHSGDTLTYPGLEDQLQKFDIDVALLPINGNLPERRVAGNLNGEEAARLAKAIGAKTVIPCHYEMFAFNTAPPALFVTACAAVGQSQRVLQAGEKFIAE
ncbi:MAG: MBL fold metallo-hydrolase [Rhodothermales bacterium]|nr:MBL fold metallo-hydrolase [Rhodothermales bacterium]